MMRNSEYPSAPRLPLPATIYLAIRRRLFYSAALGARAIFSLLPTKLGIALLTLLHGKRLIGSTFVTTVFRPVASRRLLRATALPLPKAIERRYPLAMAEVLAASGLHRETVALFSDIKTRSGSRREAELLARAQFEVANFDAARTLLSANYTALESQADFNVLKLRSKLELIAGNDALALELFKAASIGLPYLLCPHQNMAAHYPYLYIPNHIDRKFPADGKMYDLCNYVGQRVTHVGEGQLGAALYAKALDCQDRLRTNLPQLSKQLREVLDRLDIKPPDLRLLPVEWARQIGHEGMIDILLRMRALGWWTGMPVLLAAPSEVANDVFLNLYAEEVRFLVPGGNIAPDVASELFSLQRYFGFSLNAFRLPDGSIVPWQEAGALAIREWENSNRPSPVRASFDKTIGGATDLTASFESAREQWGLKPNDWYVCLHMRDASHYGEASGAGQTHRNAAVRNYISAIKHITRQGGWVIKLGGKASPSLPKIDRVIDYSRSPLKSELMDLQLIRSARYFIGTTSGLTNVAVSLNVPCALVNCVTVDAQLWGKNVRFMMKPVQKADGSLLSQRELTSIPWRWRMFSAETLRLHNAKLLENSADEILETVKEVEALAAGRSQDYESAFPGAAAFLDSWRDSLAIPHFFGNARPSLASLGKCSSNNLAGNSTPDQQTTPRPGLRQARRSRP